MSTAEFVAQHVFELSDQQAALAPEEATLIEQVRELAAKTLAPSAKRYDESGEFPWSNLKALNELGLNGMIIPEDCGGVPLSYQAYLLTLREISRACASTGLIWATNFHATNPIVDSATDEQRKRFLPCIASGGLAAIAITEDHAGSDATAMQTTFAAEEDGVIVRGSKCYITNGDNADILLVFGKWKDLGEGKDSITALVVERKAASGMNVIRVEDKVGHRASSTAALAFDNVRVPMANVLGRPGDGLTILQNGLNKSRPSVAAHSIGIARAALDDLLIYGNSRKVGNKSILEHQANQFKLAELVGELLQCESMLWSVARMATNPSREFSILAGILKLKAAEIAMSAADACLQFHGGAGYCKEYRAERLWRDARLTPIGEGAREVLLTLIGRRLTRPL